MLRNIRYILLMLSLLTSSVAAAQDLPERGEVRRGYKAFLDEDYEKAAEHFERAVEFSPESFEAKYNLGSTKFKSEDMESAEKLFAELAADSLQSDPDRAHTYFNLGNSQLAQQKFEEALESYKSSMRLDPDDMEAKYNYAYTKALMEQNQDQNEDQNQDQDENQDENEDQQDENQDQEGDQGEDDQNQDQDQDEQDQDQDEDGENDPQDGEDQPQDGEPQPQEGAISEQEQQQMLDAIQAQEDKTQEDMKERAAGVIIPGAKNW